MESEDLEELLESVFDLEEDDWHEIYAAEGTPLPSQLRWIANEGSYVVKDQILAILSPLHEDEQTSDHKYVTCVEENESDVTNDKGVQCLNADEFDLSGKNGNCSNMEIDLVSASNVDNNYEDISANLSTKKPDNLLLRSTVSGKLHRLVPNLAEIKTKSDILGRIESSECNHEVVIHGLCVYCSTLVNPPKEDDYDIDQSDPKRRCGSFDQVVPGFITNDSAMRINSSLAYDMEYNEILKVLQKRKLCLVLDLDNTLLHASSQKLPSDVYVDEIDFLSKDADIFKDVQYNDDEGTLKLRKKFESSIIQTMVYNESETMCCKSYFKLRPGVFKFLKEMSAKFELYLFTMGTKQHASSSLKILDPKRIYFGNRIFCRNDSRSSMKSLDRIFPKHKNLVLIVDDTEHVWTCNLGLIKIHPYFFFPDLSYLQFQDIRTLTRISAALQAPGTYSNFVWHMLEEKISEKTDSTNADKNDEQLKDGDGFLIPSAIKRKIINYNNLFISNERPSNIYINPINELSEKSSNTQDNHNSTELFKKVYVRDNDAQLLNISELLEKVHSMYYDEFDRVVDGFSTDSIAVEYNTSSYDEPTSKNISHEGNSKYKQSYSLDMVKQLLDTKTLPEAGTILQDIRKNVMSKVCLYANPRDFTCPKTGRIVDFLAHSDFGQWASKFGAKITISFDESVTHYLCNNPHNDEIQFKHNAKKVHVKWLEAVLYTWKLVEEDKFNASNWSDPIRSFWDLL
ncbi:conserved hypothetical protein [Theileria equi strain WA]|uniref:protein-serine/threonine phosphatase n=1 Tax=Theileria equi strain WA TaxID=1537102 RepID=L1LCP9_THEEQ|nr:conserved hypothetical protein [Theileria equi strain WA]EKX73116.1 conserved hypothetical protein [Theileria equi strain WA]|eukprot:XP_004832568.1 conserved hypothetical protein [Theileria equi strain WA]